MKQPISARKLLFSTITVLSNSNVTKPQKMSV